MSGQVMWGIQGRASMAKPPAAQVLLKSQGQMLQSRVLPHSRPPRISEAAHALHCQGKRLRCPGVPPTAAFAAAASAVLAQKGQRQVQHLPPGKPPAQTAQFRLGRQQGAFRRRGRGGLP